MDRTFRAMHAHLDIVKMSKLRVYVVFREPVKCCLRVFSYLAWTLECLNRDCLFGTRDQQKIVLGFFSSFSVRACGVFQSADSSLKVIKLPIFSSLLGSTPCCSLSI